MKLYYDLSPGALKVILLLAELSIAYEPIPVDIRKQPDKQVPTLEDDDVTVFDSNAVLIYLAEKENRLLPNTAEREKRATALSWLFLIATEVENACLQVRHFRYIAPKPSDYALRLFEYELNRHLLVIERQLSQHVFITGDEYGIVDIAFWSWARLLPNIFGLDQTDQGYHVLWQRYPNIKRLLDLIEQRPAVKHVELLKTKHNFKVARRYRPALGVPSLTSETVV
jgi:GSH-dependent disulfide-bond oxidoreductase